MQEDVRRSRLKEDFGESGGKPPVFKRINAVEIDRASAAEKFTFPEGQAAGSFWAQAPG
jgi:hypothetical protein